MLIDVLVYAYLIGYTLLIYVALFSLCAYTVAWILQLMGVL